MVNSIYNLRSRFPMYQSQHCYVIKWLGIQSRFQNCSFDHLIEFWYRTLTLKLKSNLNSNRVKLTFTMNACMTSIRRNYDCLIWTISIGILGATSTTETFIAINIANWTFSIFSATFSQAWFRPIFIVGIITSPCWDSTLWSNDFFILNRYQWSSHFFFFTKSIIMSKRKFSQVFILSNKNLFLIDVKTRYTNLKANLTNCFLRWVSHTVRFILYKS